MYDNNTILIAGCGYIGKKVAQLLQGNNNSFNALVNSQKSQQLCQQQNIACQIINLDDDTHSLNLRADIILYTIAPQPRGNTDTRIKRFLSSLTHAPKKIILISTTGVYGDCQGNWIDESSLVNPQADRAKRRINAEQQLSDYAKQHHCEIVILRVAGIYAADKLPLKRIQSGEPILREEDSGFSNRIHADDLAQICFEACTSKNMQGIYNCTDGHPSTMCDYFKRVAKALNLPAPREINIEQAQKELSAGMLSYLAESKRIRNERLLNDLSQPLDYPNLDLGLANITNKIKSNCRVW